MVDTALLETLELLNAAEQKAVLAVAQYLRSHRSGEPSARSLAEALIAESTELEPHFASSDEGLSPARLAARQFMRENPALMHLLAK